MAITDPREQKRIIKQIKQDVEKSVVELCKKYLLTSEYTFDKGPIFLRLGYSIRIHEAGRLDTSRPFVTLYFLNNSEVSIDTGLHHSNHADLEVLLEILEIANSMMSDWNEQIKD